MTEAGYRLVIANAKVSYAANIAAAMAQHSGGRAVHLAGRTRAVVARMPALGGLGSAVRVASLSRKISRSAPRGGEPVPVAGYRSSIAERAAPKIARRSPPVLAVLPKTKIAAVAVHRTMRVARAAGAAKASDAAATLITGPRLRSLISAQTQRHGLTRRGAGARDLAVPAGFRLAARVSARSDAAHRGRSFLTPGIAARLRRRVAAPPPQQADAPGFHRTVRQSRTTAPAGNVYLDKTLVGYHLAAAITAEQTRAAARPNISGSSFNSSMAALRPSGAGL